MRCSTSAVITLLSALSLASSRLTNRTTEISDFCTFDYTYEDIWHPDDAFGAVFTHASVSDSQLCCDLCYRTKLNCAVARWNEKTGDCEMQINDQKTEEPAEEELELEMCPLGISSDGVVSDKIYDRNWHWVGPCWEPLDLSDGVEDPDELLGDPCPDLC